MHVLVGECTGGWANELPELGWGRMWIARGRNIYTYPGEPWGLDNGAFRDWTNRPEPMQPEQFDGDQFMRVLRKADEHPRPMLAVVPDLPGHPDSLAYSLRWRERLPDGWPWYVAVQDGTGPEAMMAHAPGFSGVFLGGTDAYKATAGEWVAFCREYGLRFHYGRCGTLAKIAHAKQVGADSIDSATAMWTKTRWRMFREALTIGNHQHDFFWEAP